MEKDRQVNSHELSDLQTPQMANSPLAILKNGFPAYPVNVQPSKNDILISDEEIDEAYTKIGN